MKRSILYIPLLALCLSISCKSDKKEEVPNETNVEADAKTNNTPPPPPPPVQKDEPDYYKDKKKLTLSLDSKSSSNVTGNVVFTQDQGVVTMIAVLSGLTEGQHAIHIHQTADCTADDGSSSGGHWNPTAQPHGAWGAKTGYHKGDIGNLTADANGHAMITKVTDEWCIGCGDETKDIVGKAIIVHQGIDDLKSQPSGAAGSRVSCGGIIE